MLTSLFPGRACSISFRSTVAEGEAILTDQNTINAETGSKIVVQIGSKTYYLTVAGTTRINDLINRDNVILHGITQTATGRFRRISETRYRLYKAMGTKKARLSLVAILCSIGIAAATTINASQHGASSTQPCTGFGCVTRPTWILMGLSAAAGVFGWAKDNIL